MWLRRFRITDRYGASQIGSVIPRAGLGGAGHIQGDSGQLTGSVIRYWGGGGVWEPQSLHRLIRSPGWR